MNEKPDPLHPKKAADGLSGDSAAPEPDTYELAEDPADDFVAPPAPPPVAPPVAPPAAPSSASTPKPAASDARSRSAPPAAPDSGQAARPASPGGIISGLEPEAVSPAKAQAQREQQRIRAAQEQAAADAKRRKIVAGVIGAIVVLGVLAVIIFR